MVSNHSEWLGRCISTGTLRPHCERAVRIVCGTFNLSTRFTSQNKLGVCSTRRSAESALALAANCWVRRVVHPNFSRRKAAASSSPTLPLRREFSLAKGFRLVESGLRGTFLGLGMVRKAALSAASVRPGFPGRRDHLPLFWL